LILCRFFEGLEGDLEAELIEVSEEAFGFEVS
jgi:hypothetical protein